MSSPKKQKKMRKWKKKCLMLKINNRESNEMNSSGMEADKSHKTLSPTLPWSEQKFKFFLLF